MTSFGENTVNFDWLTRPYLADADDTYCLRLTVNDGLDDQIQAATTTLVLDNIDPSPAGALASAEVTTGSIRLAYAVASPGSDTNEPLENAYRIYYKKAQSGVTTGDTEIDNSDLDAYDFNGATSTLLSGLDQNSWYVFNIWAYDAFGNQATATEVAIKTNATISNDSLTFVNAVTSGSDTNLAIATSGAEWIFRAVVTETNGWYAIASTTLRLANNADNDMPFDDLVFDWDQTADTFHEIGADAADAVSLSANSSSDCSDNTCAIDFVLAFNKDFTDPSVEYSTQLASGNDSGTIDADSYVDFYQVRFPYIEQIHYRFRNDDGGE
jgi:hypothetical protein